MTHGNLDGKLVHHEFWTDCQNCAHFFQCQNIPRHPAFPHTWHWGKEDVDFAEGILITRSWVGTIAHGEDHTGCSHYEVNPVYLLPLSPSHQQYLALLRQIEQKEDRLSQLNETDGSQAAQDLGDELDILWEKLHSLNK